MINNNDGLLLNKMVNWKKPFRRVQEKWNTLAIFKDDKLILRKFNNLDYKQSDLKETIIPDVNINHSKNEYEYIQHLFKIEHTLRNEYWELAAYGEKETFLQKYYRLKFETEDLIQEINFQKGNIHFNEKICVHIGFQIQDILAKLSKNNIEKYHRYSEIYNSRNYVTDKVVNQILCNNDEVVNCNNNSNVLNIEVLLKSNTLNTEELSQISHLEKQLQKLEMIVGSEKYILKRFGSFNNNGLMNAVYSLKKQCKLNLPKMYEIESKVFIVLSKLEKITTILDYNNLEIGEKIDELYKIILKEKESHLLPYVIQRMNTLKIFCQKVGTFAVTDNNFNVQYSKTSEVHKSNELLLNNIESHITKNVAKVVMNLQSLNTQIEVLGNRLKCIDL